MIILTWNDTEKSLILFLMANDLWVRIELSDKLVQR